MDTATRQRMRYARIRNLTGATQHLIGQRSLNEPDLLERIEIATATKHSLYGGGDSIEAFVVEFERLAAERRLA